MSNKHNPQPKGANPQPGQPQPGQPQAQQGAPLAPGQPSAQSLEQVREILFGQQSRDLEQRFAGLQADFQKAITQMGDEARKQRETVQSQLRDELTKLSKQIDAMREQQGQAMQQMKSEFGKSMEQAKDEQSKAAQQLKDQQSQALSSAKDQMNEQAKEMKQAMERMSEQSRKDCDELRTEMKRQTGELNRKADATMQQIGQEANQLRNEMVDRGMMSGVLSEMALRISGPAMTSGGAEDDLGMDELLASRMSDPTSTSQPHKGNNDPKGVGKNGPSGKR